MTKSELLAALAALPDDTPVVLDVGDGCGYLDLAVHVDAEGVRLAPADDPEGREFAEAVHWCRETKFL